MDVKINFTGKRKLHIGVNSFLKKCTKKPVVILFEVTRVPEYGMSDFC